MSNGKIVLEDSVVDFLKEEIGEGTTLYQHHIILTDSNNTARILVSIVTASDTAFTTTTLATYISNNGSILFDTIKGIQASGYIENSGSYLTVYALREQITPEFFPSAMILLQLTNLTDTVTQI